jgi:anti-sigma-K factor RskA
VLGALTDAESDAFRRHLDSCTICREEVAALQVVACALPAAAPQIAAPSELKRRVMGEVGEDATRDERGERSRMRRRVSSRATRRRPAFGALAAVAAAAVAAALLIPGAGGARVIRAQVYAPHASALLRLQGGAGQLTITGLAQPPRGRVYEVWLKGSGEPRPTDALFTVSSRGDATVGVPGVTSAVREVMVTSEPLGGSRRPTRSPVIVARVG